ncbi:MAG: FG-GAP repeat domain-containing protein, partial [Candidatus Thorarchaeota archaeon]
MRRTVIVLIAIVALLAAMVQTTPGTRIAAEQVPVLRQAFTTTDQTPVLLWSYTTGDWVCSSAALGDVDGDGKLEVVIGSRDDKVYCLNGEDGSVLWSYATGIAVDSSAALGDVDGDGKLEVVIGSYDNKVYCLNGEDGSVLWSCATGASVDSS